MHAAGERCYGRGVASLAAAMMIVAAGALSFARTAAALERDEDPPATVTVKGDTIRGEVERLTPDGIEFSTIYGTGVVKIPYEDLEGIETPRPFVVLYGTDRDTEVRGRLIGVDDGGLLVGDAEETATRVEMTQIRTGVVVADYDESLLTRLRTRYRHWTAEVDLGSQIEEGAVDKQKVNLGLALERRKAPTRYTFDLRYAFENEKRRDAPTQNTKDELFSMLRAEYDLTERAFGIGLGGGEFDRPRRVEGRFFMSGGPGYKVFDNKRLRLSVFGGLGFVFEEFNTGSMDQGTVKREYGAMMIGTEGSWRLPRDSVLRGYAFYMPSFQGPGDHWLLRFELGYAVPIWDPLALKAGVRNVFDDNPSDDTGNNKFTTFFGLAVQF